jgi:integrase/recombinase XerD
LGPRHIREYQAELFQKQKLAASTVRQRLAALRFFYTKTLRKAWSIEETPYPKKVLRLATILSAEEVAQLIDAALTPYHHTLLMTLYATGMRRAELARLKVNDVDSKRMVIHVQGGKGRKDRDVMLSPMLLEELHAHGHRLRGRPACSSFPAITTTAGISRSIRKPFGMRVITPPRERASRKSCIRTRFATVLQRICSRLVPISEPFRFC